MVSIMRQSSTEVLKCTSMEHRHECFTLAMPPLCHGDAGIRHLLCFPLGYCSSTMTLNTGGKAGGNYAVPGQQPRMGQGMARESSAYYRGSSANIRSIVVLLPCCFPTLSLVHPPNLFSLPPFCHITTNFHFPGLP